MCFDFRILLYPIGFSSKTQAEMMKASPYSTMLCSRVFLEL